MTRALIVATVPQHLTAFHLPFVEHFRAKGWVVHGMARNITTNPACVDAFDRVWDAPFSRSPTALSNIVAARRIVQSVVANGEYDIVHVHTPVAAFVVRFALRKASGRLRPKVIYTAHGFHFYHGGNPVRNLVFRTLERLAGPWTDFLVVMNEEDFQAASRYEMVPADRLSYMPGIGLDLAKYSGESTGTGEVERVRDELGLERDASLFLMVAEFIPRKRHIDVLEAFAGLDTENSYLALAGTGKLLKSMQEKAKELGIADNVRWLGFRTDVPDLLRASTALILPSLHEGLPRSLMEALCLGVPCIGSDIRGTRDLLGQGKGMLFSPGNVNELRSAMERIIDSPELRKEIVAKGRSDVDKYDVRRIIELHEALYDKALSS